ncbi:MAG: 3-phosphoglycerate dehydrogenase [Alphaproteobacteria bacterium]|nr:3-phosphoglycerate dehydrogenase [Alphaproteobacteria bacterium]
MKRVLYFDCSEDIAKLYAEAEGLSDIVPELELHIGEPSEAELLELLGGCTGVLNGHTKMSEGLMTVCSDLRVIVFLGTGVASYVDMDAAAARGIAVHRIAGYGNRTIAEHALMLMLAGVRKLTCLDRDLRAGKWQPDGGFELEGKTLGIVGLGGVGRTMAAFGAALGMRVIAWNRSGVPDGVACEAVDIDTVMAESDVVSLHVDLVAETRGIIDRRRLELMRPHAVLVNTARGALVDEAALAELLQAGQIGHAALDVYGTEPLPADSPFRDLDNVTLTPHAAWVSPEATTRLLRMGLEQLRDALAALE